MTIAVTGASGHLGHIVVQGLKAKVPAGELVAIARSPAKAADLGIAVREADYDKPATLGRALDGIDTLMLISASELGKRAAQHHNVIHAARHAGIKWIAYTSVLHADISPLDLAAEHLATEAEILASGIPFTILRNGWYTENYTATLPAAVAAGAIIGSAGDARISSATRADYAAAAVAVLTGTGHQGQTYELAGDEAWTLTDLAAEVSRQIGRAIPYRNLSAADYAATLKRFGMSEEMARTIAGWDVAASKGALFDDSGELSRLVGRPTTPLSAAVAEALASAAKRVA